MSRKLWNAGVVVVLTALLTMAPSLRFGTAYAAGNSDATATSHSDLQLARCATLHRVDTPSPGGSHLDIHVESLPGMLMTKSAEGDVQRLLLLNSRIPADLAGRVHVSHPLLSFVELLESGWGHESEARINLAVAPGVVAITEEGEGVMHIRLSQGSERFTVNIIETPYPVLAGANAAKSQALKADLLDIASSDEAQDGGAWWPEYSTENMRSVLRSVRTAEIDLKTYDASIAAAQEEDVVVEEAAPAEEAPAAEEVEEPMEEWTKPVPPPKRAVEHPIGSEANKGLMKRMIEGSEPDVEAAPRAPLIGASKTWKGDPLMMPVTMDLRNVELGFVVSMLGTLANINVVAGTDYNDADLININLRDVPLMQAMETALSLRGMGIVEQEGIYVIKDYYEAVTANRTTEVVAIENADAADIAATLTSVMDGSEFSDYISVSSNKAASSVLISGPAEQIEPLVLMAKRLDVEQMVLPTVTLPIKLNYADPTEMLTVIEPLKTVDVGQVTIDERARIIVVTDIPIVVEKIAELIEKLDMPVKQVAIDAMIVDVTLTDAADTGVDWLISAVQSQSRRDAAGNTGIFTGNLQELSLNSGLSIGDAAGLLNFGVLSGDIDWRGVIQAEVRNNNSTLLSNPKLITVENKEARIVIASEIPFVEIVESVQGGGQTNTEFKPIGTELVVTPQVTHDNHIIAAITAKESTSTQTVNGIPVEDKRQIETTPHLASGQTIYVGGLRKNNDLVNIRKVPVLGDVPVLNFLFRSNQRSETVNELLIFLTCTVLDEEMPLTEYQEKRANEVREARIEVSAETNLIYDAVNPGEMRDPAWKWRKHSK